MSGGDGGDCGGAEIGCGDLAASGPVAAAGDAGNYAEAVPPGLPIVNGVEINRAKILEKAHELIVGKERLAAVRDEV